MVQNHGVMHCGCSSTGRYCFCTFFRSFVSSPYISEGTPSTGGSPLGDCAQGFSEMSISSIVLASSLVNVSRTRRSRRAYSRVFSGLERSLYLGFRIVRRGKFSPLRKGLPCIMVLTLTSSEESDGRINDAWSALLKRIRRIDSSFEFCKLRTNEGVCGVLHVVCRARNFISHEWLCKNWNDTFKAKITYSQQAYGDLRRLANYLVGYLNHHEYWHLGVSKNWIFKGFALKWKETFSAGNLNRYGFKVCLANWKKVLYTYESPLKGRVVALANSH